MKGPKGAGAQRDDSIGRFVNLARVPHTNKKRRIQHAADAFAKDLYAMSNRPYDFCIAAAAPSGDGSALYTVRLDRDGGDLHIEHALPLAGPTPSFFAVANSRRDESILYSLCGKEVCWFAIGDDGQLAVRGSAPIGSEGAAHLCTDANARFLFTANYGSGDVSMLPIGDDGSLGKASVYKHGPGAHHGAVGTWGEGPQFRQESAHPHGVAVYGDHLYVADLGTNGIVCWSIDGQQGILQPAGAVTVHDLAGPRHVQVTRSGQWAFALNELDNTLCAFRRSGDGSLELAQTLSTIPDGWAEEHGDPTTFPNEVYSKPSHASQLLISPDDRFVYASNRGHDSIAVYSIDEEKGSIALVQVEPSLGRIPWICCLSHDGRFMLAQNNHTRANEAGPDSVVVFQRDVDSGRLGPMAARLEFPAVSSLWTLPG